MTYERKQRWGREDLGPWCMRSCHGNLTQCTEDWGKARWEARGDLFSYWDINIYSLHKVPNHQSQTWGTNLLDLLTRHGWKVILRAEWPPKQLHNQSVTLKWMMTSSQSHRWSPLFSKLSSLYILSTSYLETQRPQRINGPRYRREELWWGESPMTLPIQSMGPILRISCKQLQLLWWKWWP